MSEIEIYREIFSDMKIKYNHDRDLLASPTQAETLENREWAPVDCLPRDQWPAWLQEVKMVDGTIATDLPVVLKHAERAGEYLRGQFTTIVTGALNLPIGRGKKVEMCRGANVERFFFTERGAGGVPQEGEVVTSKRQAGSFDDGELQYIHKKVNASTEKSANGEDDGGHQLRLAGLEMMLEREKELAIELASPFGPDCQHLVLRDGPLHMHTKGEAHFAIVGMLKTMRLDVLGPEKREKLGDLKAGQRTPVLLLQGTGDNIDRAIWYVRLADKTPNSLPHAGVQRLEMAHSPEALSRILEVADISGTLLQEWASVPYKDSRAPNNLVPMASLEGELHRHLGDSRLIGRRLEQFFVSAE